MTRTILLFGLAAGVLIAALQFVDYRLLVIDHSVQMYGAIVAVIFSAVGIGLGLTLTRHREIVREIAVTVEVPAAVVAPAAPFLADDAKRQALGVTPRELEILGLIASGLSTREIAERLFVSENTVKTHATRLFDKLGARRRTQAVLAGRTFGLIP